MIARPTALVTGGAKRIGQALCLKLATMGFDIALSCNSSKTQAEKTAHAIKQIGVNCTLFRCDLSKEKAVQKLIKQVKMKCPRISLLVNNASIFEPSTLKSGSLQSLNRHMDINFKAPFILTQEFARQIKKGHIINILDTHITRNQTNHFTYLLSKKALHALTQQSAVALAPEIRVNAISPGLILAPSGKDNNYLNRLAKTIPLKRKGSVEHLTSALTFLIENDYLTGQTIFVDGGEHLHGNNPHN